MQTMKNQGRSKVETIQRKIKNCSVNIDTWSVPFSMVFCFPFYFVFKLTRCIYLFSSLFKTGTAGAP